METASAAGLGILASAAYFGPPQPQQQQQQHEEAHVTVRTEYTVLSSRSSRSLIDLRDAYDAAFDTNAKDDAVIAELSRRLNAAGSVRSPIAGARFSRPSSPFKRKSMMANSFVQRNSCLSYLNSPSNSGVPAYLQPTEHNDESDPPSPSPSPSRPGPLLRRPRSMFELNRLPGPPPDMPLPPLPSPPLPPPLSPSVRERHAAPLKDALRSSLRMSLERESSLLVAEIDDLDFYQTDDEDITISLRKLKDAAPRASSSTLPSSETRSNQSDLEKGLLESLSRLPIRSRPSRPSLPDSSSTVPREVAMSFSHEAYNFTEADLTTLLSPAIEKGKSGRVKKEAAKVELDIILQGDTVVGNGFIEGRLQVKFSQFHKDKLLRLGRPQVRILGFEEVSGENTRRIFYQHDSGNHVYLTAPIWENIDVEGFAILHSAETSIPFRVHCPQGHNRSMTHIIPSANLKHARIRYIAVTSILIKSAASHSRDVAHCFHDIKVFPRLDPVTTLHIAPDTIKAQNEKTLLLGGSGHVVLKAALHRATWVAGQKVYVQLAIQNDSSKKLNRLHLAVIRQATLTGGMKKEARNAARPSFKIVTEHLFNKTEGTSHGMVGVKGWWKGVQSGETLQMLHSIDVPSDAVTVEDCKRFQVQYLLQISLGAPFSTDVHVTLPIRVVNYVSLDPPPGQDISVSDHHDTSSGSLNPSAGALGVTQIQKAMSMHDLRKIPRPFSPALDRTTVRLRPTNVKHDRIVLPQPCTQSASQTESAPSTGTRAEPARSIAAVVGAQKWTIPDSDLESLLYSPAFSEGLSMPSSSEAGHSTFSEGSEQGSPYIATPNLHFNRKDSIQFPLRNDWQPHELSKKDEELMPPPKLRFPLRSAKSSPDLTNGVGPGGRLRKHFKALEFPSKLSPILGDHRTRV